VFKDIIIEITNEVKLYQNYTKIPESISWLCQQRLQNSNKTYEKIWEYIQADQFLHLLFPNIFEPEHAKKDLKVQMGSYGVKGVRDRLAGLYLSYLTEGKWLKSPDLSYVLEVQQFEERFNDFSNEWDSRIFMLGFYLRAKDLENEKYYELDEYEINLPLEVDEILTHGKAKIEKLDWLIVTIKSLLKFKKKDEIIAWLKGESKDFFDIISTLDTKEQKIFLEDLLCYGHAIGDLDFFVFDKI
jgi:hypothetical protein